MVVVKKVGVLSFAKIEAFFLFLFGVFDSTSTAIMQYGFPQYADTLGLPPGGVPVLYLIGMPFIWAFVGLVLGAVVASFYNLISRYIGGIKVTLEEQDHVVPIRKIRK